MSSAAVVATATGLTAGRKAATWALGLVSSTSATLLSRKRVSEWFVDSIDATAEQLGLSKAFIGLVIVAIAGNAV